MPALAAVRLPAGWSAGADDGGGAVAGPQRRRPGDPLVFHRTAPLPPGGVPVVVAGTVAGLDAQHDELQVLDREPVAARRGTTGERLLTTWRDGARSITAEHWLLAHDERLHVLAAVMDTRCYAATAEIVRRSLGTLCPAGRRPSVPSQRAVTCRSMLPRRGPTR